MPDFQELRQSQDVVDPPTSLGLILRQIGPGLIIAANIVGSGELIMTTKTGAEAGISLLWLIIVGCLVKVFVQLEFGRYTISQGETTLSSLNRVPGPRILGINWVVLWWAVMMIATVGQLGGIVGGVGQSLAMTVPFSGDYLAMIETPATTDITDYAEWRRQYGDADQAPDSAPEIRRMRWIARDLNALGDRGTELLKMATDGVPLVDKNGTPLDLVPTNDDRTWVIIMGVVTAGLLYYGRYGFIEKASVILVVSFTLITIGNVISLQMTKDYAISGAEILRGLSFGLPERPGAMLTALATFGIIGVGATELISYPYWCMEKGYARSCGPRDDSDGWLRRALGWYRVMRVDAFASMVIYTAATAAFYFLGVAVLHSEGRNPAGMRMVSTVAESYVPVFGEYAKWLFLIGAFAVLYSTYLVANAGNARMMADFAGVMGWCERDPDGPRRKSFVRGLSTFLPLACVAAFILIPKPVHLIALSGLTQAIMLPILALSSIYFRHTFTDPRLRPGKLWDACLILSSTALLIAGVWGVFEKSRELFG